LSYGRAKIKNYLPLSREALYFFRLKQNKQELCIKNSIAYKNKQFQSYCKVKILTEFQPYLIFSIKIVVIRAIDIVFAAITGMLEIMIP
jgi:hypothetical protein